MFPILIQFFIFFLFLFFYCFLFLTFFVFPGPRAVAPRDLPTQATFHDHLAAWFGEVHSDGEAVVDAVHSQPYPSKLFNPMIGFKKN